MQHPAEPIIYFWGLFTMQHPAGAIIYLAVVLFEIAPASCGFCVSGQSFTRPSFCLFGRPWVYCGGEVPCAYSPVSYPMFGACDVSLGCTCGERQVGGWGLGGEVGLACVVYWPFRFDTHTANLIDAGVNDRPRWGCIVSTPRRMYMQLSR